MYIQKGTYIDKKQLSDQAIVYNKFSERNVEINVFQVHKGFRFSLNLTNDFSTDVYWIIKGRLIQPSTKQEFEAFDTIVLNHNDRLILLEALEDTSIYSVSSGGTLFQKSKDNFLFIDKTMGTLQDKDHYTREHCERVWRLSRKMGDYLNLTDAEITAFSKAAKYHDIGKIEISDAILNKPGKLTTEEFALMKEHVLFGRERLLKHYGEAVTNIILEHHERLDGSGYPYGLKGEEISELGKALAVIDTFDAMTTDRVYKKGKSIPDAFKELHALSGTQYDRKYVELLEKIVTESSDE